MSTDAIRARNQANAAHSTGPKTAEGKNKARFNAIRHGLTGQVVVLPGEDMEAYLQNSADLAADFQPFGSAEQNLVQSIADAQWQLNRARAIEHAYFALGAQASLASELASVSLAGSPPDLQLAYTLSLVDTWRNRHKELDSLSRHANRLHRQILQNIDKLHVLQQHRTRQGALHRRAEAAAAAHAAASHAAAGASPAARAETHPHAAKPLTVNAASQSGFVLHDSASPHSAPPDFSRSTAAAASQTQEPLPTALTEAAA